MLTDEARPPLEFSFRYLCDRLLRVVPERLNFTGGNVRVPGGRIITELKRELSATDSTYVFDELAIRGYLLGEERRLE
jgi:hypothetical protein